MSKELLQILFIGSIMCGGVQAVPETDEASELNCFNCCERYVSYMQTCHVLDFVNASANKAFPPLTHEGFSNRETLTPSYHDLINNQRTSHKSFKVLHVVLCHGDKNFQLVMNKHQPFIAQFMASHPRTIGKGA